MSNVNGPQKRSIGTRTEPMAFGQLLKLHSLCLLQGGDVKALEKKIDELQAAVESIGASGDTHHPLALPKPTPTVAVHPPGVSCSCRQAADGGEDTQLKNFRRPSASPSADETPRKEPKSGEDLHRVGVAFQELLRCVS